MKATEAPVNKEAGRLARKKERRRAKKAMRELRLSNAARGTSSLVSNDSSTLHGPSRGNQQGSGPTPSKANDSLKESHS